MAIYKNVASQKLAVYAYTVADGAAKTGDAAQITAYLSKDWAAPAALADTNPTELDSTNMPGWYVFDLAQAETNAEVLVVAPKSSTSGVVLDQVQVFTLDAAISSRASQTSVDDVPTAVEIVAAIDADPPAVNVTTWKGDTPLDLSGDGEVQISLSSAQRLAIQTVSSFSLDSFVGNDVVVTSSTDFGDHLVGALAWLTYEVPGP